METRSFQFDRFLLREKQNKEELRLGQVRLLKGWEEQLPESLVLLVGTFVFQVKVGETASPLERGTVEMFLWIMIAKRRYFTSHSA